jgi:hypothetical protein
MSIENWSGLELFFVFLEKADIVPTITEEAKCHSIQE